MKFTIEEYAVRIEASQKRGRAESAMQTFLGGDGFAQGQSPQPKTLFAGRFAQAHPGYARG